MENIGTRYSIINGEYDEPIGSLRLQNVSAGRGDKSYLSWDKVEAKTGEFVDWLNARLAQIGNMSADEIYNLSLKSHYRLDTIHPWSDGNGRAARLLMNLIQIEGVGSLGCAKRP